MRILNRDQKEEQNELSSSKTIEFENVNTIPIEDLDAMV